MEPSQNLRFTEIASSVKLKVRLTWNGNIFPFSLVNETITPNSNKILLCGGFSNGPDSALRFPNSDQNRKAHWCSMDVDQASVFVSLPSPFLFSLSPSFPPKPPSPPPPPDKKLMALQCPMEERAWAIGRIEVCGAFLIRFVWKGVLAYVVLDVSRS